jgi:hypothetical protein
MGAFFRLIAAGPMFFVSAWLLMIFAGIVAADTGIRPFGNVDGGHDRALAHPRPRDRRGGPRAGKAGCKPGGQD